MELFKELGANNPRVTYQVQADLEGRIKCLMWTNGSSHLRLQVSEWFTGEMNPRALSWTQQYVHSVLQIPKKWVKPEVMGVYAYFYFCEGAQIN